MEGGAMSTPNAAPVRSGYGAVLRASLIAGLVAGILCVFLWGIGSLFGTEFEVQPAGSDALQPVTFWAALFFPVVTAGIAGSIAYFLFRGPGAFLWILLIGFALTLLSLFVPLLQPSDVTWPTKLWLASMHLVTGLIVVPVIAVTVGGRTLFGRLGPPPSAYGPESGGGPVIVGEVIEVDEVVVREDPPAPPTPPVP
jgi:hypothetical protein